MPFTQISILRLNIEFVRAETLEAALDAFLICTVFRENNLS